MAGRLMWLSPHTWGCSANTAPELTRLDVVPTHVGVFRPWSSRAPSRYGCPHTRGGVPVAVPPKSTWIKLSPHTWGCSDAHTRLTRGTTLSPHTWGCSAHRAPAIHSPRSCPHTRGGVPLRFTHTQVKGALSPHTWGCSYLARFRRWFRWVVPTHVGVFLLRAIIRPSSQSCPHTRGGVPISPIGAGRCWLLSPHTWGCSFIIVTRGAFRRVVPTHVGVFRTTPPSAARIGGCPHTRGGVPIIGVTGIPSIPLSPHTWGCSVVADFLYSFITVVPTHVGVFRCFAGAD